MGIMPDQHIASATFPRELPDMMSASEGVSGKADILREVA